MTSFDSAPQRAGYLERIEALQRDPWSGLPDWARHEPEQALRNKKIVMCGSRMPGEIRFIGARYEIVGIVDDFLVKSQSDYLGYPLLTTDEWVRLARSDATIVSVIAVPSLAGDEHFSRCVAQHSLPTLRMLDLFRLCTHGIDRIAGVGNTFVYGIPFFRHACESADAQLRCADLFADDFSRFTYFSLLNYRLTGDPQFLHHCGVGTHPDRYGYNTYTFNRTFFELGDEEVLVDGGAFEGDSIEQFLGVVQGRFRKIYSFEPAPETAARCRERIARLAKQHGAQIVSKIDVIERGLWDKDAVLSFNPTMYAPTETAQIGVTTVAGHIIEGGLAQRMYKPEDESDGSFSVPVTSIDATCELPVSLIKLEIEGSELKALHGASETIRKHRPKMAISIYHKPEDLVELTRFVEQSGMGYRMGLRQHNPWVPDAGVCYCY